MRLSANIKNKKFELKRVLMVPPSFFTEKFIEKMEDAVSCPNG